MKVKVLIDHCERPYLARLELISLFGWSLKLHTFLRSDGDAEHHDHPWDFWSLVLAGSYGEDFPSENELLVRKPWSLAFRRAETRHRVILYKDEYGSELPCTTLVLTRPKRREWGFWRGSNFIHWKKFVSSRRC